MTKMRTLTTGLCGLLLVAAAACGGRADAERPEEGATALPEPGPGLSRVIMLGDSIAVGEALPLGFALDAAGVEFHSMAAEGGGNVVGPGAEERWATLPEELGSARPGTVVYQITTYDWGTEEEQREAYGRLVDTVAGLGATLVFVSAPPIVPDEFYEPHMADLERAPEVAAEAAKASDGAAVMLDAAEVWGEEYAQTVDGRPDRSTDGVHTCPQGAARFTQWLLTGFAELYPDFTPPEPQEWANVGWSGDEHFTGC
ncbi:SGNH/GDSL hydrolase family protein [Glycomyces sp. A-F 0318]|uniref:SGNH/GDSL hydrolase family protein n=1 Tax=Glycomyces amatae TaxID=2881355 RepID=UPI001E5A9665|nr:SGNH/GDSL hydrolase family protein [Glycomyces amatae]MCD0443056.1 SGNH/GDSL hydrolase family protein [Glycomyces amatae]